jgi:hypothetical protein
MPTHAKRFLLFCGDSGRRGGWLDEEGEYDDLTEATEAAWDGRLGRADYWFQIVDLATLIIIRDEKTKHRPEGI